MLALVVKLVSGLWLLVTVELGSRAWSALLRLTIFLQTSHLSCLRLACLRISILIACPLRSLTPHPGGSSSPLLKVKCKILCQLCNLKCQELKDGWLMAHYWSFLLSPVSSQSWTGDEGVFLAKVSSWYTHWKFYYLCTISEWRTALSWGRNWDGQMQLFSRMPVTNLQL